MSYQQIITNIKKGEIKPVYFLYGEEPFFIDQISDYIDQNLLDETQRGFNQMVLYGRDTSVEQIVSHAKRFPMMSDYQLVIVKEAQDLSRTIDQLETYLAQPVPTTVLVLNYKYKSPDKRKAFYKKLVKVGEVFESKKLYENQVPDFIMQHLRGKGYTIDPKAAYMLVEFLGTELSKVVNELNKLEIILPQGSNISPQDVEQNIGISKDFNNFELRKAIGTKNIIKANQIINYFEQSPKDHPVVLTITTLYNFFVQLLQFHGLPQKHDKRAVVGALKINPYFVDEYVQAAKLYPMRKVSYNIAFLREADLKIKGVGAVSVPQGQIMKELLYKLMH